MLLLVLDDAVSFGMLSQESRQKEIADSISRSVGKEVQIQIKLNESGHSFERAYVDLEQMIHAEIEYEDF